jgi:hypothetical protein
MKTDELIETLSSQAEPVDVRLPMRRLLIAAALGAAAALPLMLWQLGMNPDLAADAHRAMFWVRFAFVVAVVAACTLLVIRLGQPGAEIRRAAQAVILPILALWMLAAVALMLAAPGERMPMVMGSSWDSCPLDIGALSLPALVLLMGAARSLAPTRLRLTGAATGLLAGALGTLAYLLHCPEFDAPFIALWYVLGMTVPAAIGSVVGPRVLAW